MGQVVLQEWLEYATEDAIKHGVSTDLSTVERAAEILQRRELDVIEAGISQTNPKDRRAGRSRKRKADDHRAHGPQREITPNEPSTRREGSNLKPKSAVGVLSPAGVKEDGGKHGDFLGQPSQRKQTSPSSSEQFPTTESESRPQEMDLAP